MDFSEVIEYIKNKIIEGWQKNNHTLSGAAEKSIFGEVTKTDTGYKVEVKGNKYIIFQNRGVLKENIPFSPGSGKKHSKYIAGLIKYGQMRKGLDEKEAKSFAFAVAYKHKGLWEQDSTGGMQLRTGGKGTRFMEEIEQSEVNKLIKEQVSFITHKIWH